MLVVKLGAERATLTAAITWPVLAPLLPRVLVLIHSSFQYSGESLFPLVPMFCFNLCMITCELYKYIILTINNKNKKLSFKYNLKLMSYSSVPCRQSAV